MRRHLWVPVPSLLLILVVSAAAAGAAETPFVDITKLSGIKHLHHKPMLDNKLDPIMPWMASVGASAAAVDYDNDGDIDLYVTNSRLGTENRLFRNNGDATFVEVGREAGVAQVNDKNGVSMAVAFGDYDNDGWLDLYVVKWGSNRLYRALGDGTFSDVSERAGVGDSGNGNTAVWLDHDGDGDLDLYVGNYFRPVDLWNLADSRQMHSDFETARDGGANVFYLNNGDGTFSEIAGELGLADTGWTLDIGAADFDNDGDQDLVLANDFGQDRVFLNNGDGSFSDITDRAIGWDTHKGMNVDFGDYNNDGWLDLYITNIWTQEYVKEGNQLYRNMGKGTFADVSFETGVYDGGWCWAGRFFDFDNDADLDLMIANGYISANPEKEYFTELATTVTRPGFDPVDARNWPAIGDSTFAGYEPSRVWRNDGGEVFTEAASALGLADPGDGRGLAIADYDNDGDLDVYISNQGQEGVLYRNDHAVGGWLEIDLQGTVSNRNAIGARVRIVTGKTEQIREVNGGNGDHSQCPYRLHVGLGEHDSVELLEIRWPSGQVEQFKDVKANRIVRYVEPAQAAPEHQVAAPVVRRPATVGPSAVISIQGPAKIELLVKHLEAELANAPTDNGKRFELVQALAAAGRRAEALSELEVVIRAAPSSMLYSNSYRALIRSAGELFYDRSILFFEGLVDVHPNLVMPRLNKALAYVDKMPAPQLGIVHQGILSNRSIDELNLILEQDPDCWAARFVRGMNHLHWPRKLGHAALAIEEFEQLITADEALPSSQRHPHLELAWLCLGDAHVKNRDVGLEISLAAARTAWQRGLLLDPESIELARRLELLGRSNDELITAVERVRGLEDAVDTDLDLVWIER